MKKLESNEVRITKKSAHYFICECPSCNKNEAYMYIPKEGEDTTLLKCNRENKCGAVFQVNFSPSEILKSHDYISNYNEFSRNEKNDLSGCIHALATYGIIETSWRGISKEVLQEHDIFIFTQQQSFRDIIKTVSEKQAYHSTKFKERFQKGEFFESFQVVIPLYTRESNTELSGFEIRVEETPISLSNGKKLKSLSYRLSDIPNQIWNYHRVKEQVIQGKVDQLFLCESVVDALSLYELHKEEEGIEVLSVLGASKVKHLQTFLEEHREKLINTEIITAFDNDAAGKKASLFLEKSKFKNLKTFDLYKFKDVNDILINSEAEQEEIEV